MTNLTSEQFRDILHHVESCTEETPSVQHLLRRAVETFYKRFGCYPNVAAASPGSGTIFGEQTQFDDGLALSLPTPMATVVVGRKVAGNRVTIVTTADVGKPHKISFGLSECPLTATGPTWLRYVKGVMAIFCCKRTVTAFEAAIETSLPLGVGLGSAAALEIAVFTFLETMFGNRVHAIDKAVATQFAEEDFVKRMTGIVPRLCASTAKDRNAALIDVMGLEVDHVPFRNPKVIFIAVDSHFQDALYGHEYPQRSKYLRKACDILGVESMRNVGTEGLGLLEERIRDGVVLRGEDGEAERPTLIDEEWNESNLGLVLNRARFYILEMQRVQEATEAWLNGDVVTFGEKMTESHVSLKDDFGFSNPVLEFLVEASLQVDGVLGSKMVGLGLDRGGCVLTLIYKGSLQSYCEGIAARYREKEAELRALLNDKLARDMAELSGMGNAQDVTEDEHDLESEQLALEGRDGGDAEGVKEGENEVDQTEVVKKKKKKCDPSAKRKKKFGKEEQMRWLEEEEEKERLRLQEEEEAKERARRLLEEEEELARRLAEEEAELERRKREMEAEAAKVELMGLSFYIINPISGARMMFPLQTDLLRSRHAVRVPQAKELVRKAVNELRSRFNQTPEAIGLAPATTTLFGEFLEYNKGYVINMALPLLTVTVGHRNDSSSYRLSTTSQEVGSRTEFRAPVPSAGMLSVQPDSWVNYAVGTVAEFKGHVPGFDAVVESSVPCELGMRSCSAFQASIYEFLEGLTGSCLDPMDSVERCQKAESRFLPEDDAKCSATRFIPTFLCREGYVILTNCRTLKMAHYYLDNPAYTFMLACCRERSSSLTVADIKERLRQCQVAANILGKDSLINADERHIRCLRKRGASEDMVRKAQYVISEQERCAKAITAIREDDFENLGVLMMQSHCSLRDDFEVSSPEVEVIVNLALSVTGVLGAKLVGYGLASTVLILARLSSVDTCIRFIRKNYLPKRDKPFFYVFRPSSGAYVMDPEESSLIP